MIITCKLLVKTFDKLFAGKKPPDEMTVIAKFNELNVLTWNIFKIIKIANVIIEYNKKILNNCFNVSALLKDKKLVNDFLKL